MASILGIPAGNATNPASGKAILLYDGNCSFCKSSIRLLKRLDWLKRFHYQDCRDIENLPACPVRLDPERLLKEMHLVVPNRQEYHTGFAAYRWMAWRLPLLWAIAPLLYLPGAMWIGNRMYLWVARNRYDLMPCQDGVCRLPDRGGK
jgi:predicted DCC family thiol-disulfide oxidoreductase YuxK